MNARAATSTWRSGIERKSGRELELMRQAGQVVAAALGEMREHARPGVTTLHLDALAEKVIAAHKARPAFKGYPGPYPFPNATTISINEELVHGIPGPRIIREGDLVSLDCGAIYQGFYADSAISLGIGHCTPLVEKLLSVTEQALAAGIEKMRPGQRTGDVSAAIQNYVESHGFKVVREYTGHGIGRNMHEDPAVPNHGKAGTGTLLRPGMTIALEPMVLVGTTETVTRADQWTVASEDGSLTAHFEHTIAVTEDQPEILTRAAAEG